MFLSLLAFPSCVVKAGVFCLQIAQPLDSRRPREASGEPWRGHSTTPVIVSDHGVKTWMAASSMASFVAVFAKTAYPTYIESVENTKKAAEAVFPSRRGVLNLL
jgi:hypothetical protein